MDAVTWLRAMIAPQHRKEFRRLAKFMIVGGIGFFVDTGALNLMVIGLHLTDNAHRTIAKAISFALAVVSNFVWNRHWTYRDSRSKSIAIQLGQFGLVSLLGLGINLTIFSLVGNWAVPRLTARFGATLGLGLGTNVAQVCAVIVVMFWNFFINRVWTYGDVS
jgi:putative flippase GtrA